MFYHGVDRLVRMKFSDQVLHDLSTVLKEAWLVLLIAHGRCVSE